ncbi:MAG: ABC transporter permease [Defluviitaleaceae bacterium]|nr:ABC transporter permease [Defluviitaleaceae bacterium]
MKMILKRVLILIPQLIIISIITFTLGAMMPGDALSGMIESGVCEEARQKQRELLGLNKPLPARYVDWAGGIMRGDFGQSFTHRRAVSELIRERAANSFALALLTLILTYSIALPLGVLAGRFSGTLIDKGILLYVFIALAMPTMVLGIFMLMTFAFGLGWFPPRGSVDAIIVAEGSLGEILLNRLYRLILPASTAALVSTVGIIFMLRANIIERKNADFAVFARAKGVPEGTVFRRHILRNSLIPVAAGLGFAISGLLTGQLFIEQIFHYPGMGSLFFSAVRAQDFAVANAIIIIFASLSALGMMLSDIFVMLADPRVRVV